MKNSKITATSICFGFVEIKKDNKHFAIVNTKDAKMYLKALPELLQYAEMLMELLPEDNLFKNRITLILNSFQHGL